MTPDITWLVSVLILNLGLFAFVALSQPVVRDLTLGFRYTISNFDERKTESVLGRRLAMIKDNQIEALMLFAPLVLLGAMSGTAHVHLSLIATTFLISRLTYAVASAAGIPLVRSLSWTVGFSASAYLGWIVWSGLSV